MKKLFVRLFEKFGGISVYQCCLFAYDEVEIPNELLK